MNDNRTWEARVYKCTDHMKSPYLAVAACKIDGVEHYILESARPEGRMALVSASDFSRLLNLLRIDPKSRDDLVTAADLPHGRFLTVAEANAEPRRGLPGFHP